MFSRSARLPHEGDLAQAAEILNSSKKIAILAGRGALDAGRELEQVADTLAAPIAKALLGKAAVPDDSPFTTGTIGLLGTRPSQEIMEHCDALLMVVHVVSLHRVPAEARSGTRHLDRARSHAHWTTLSRSIGDDDRAWPQCMP